MKLSKLQFFWLMFTFHVGNMILLTITPSVENAKQDAWISYIIANILGVIIVYFFTKTTQMFPQHTLVQLSKLLFGRFLGIIIVLSYLVMWFLISIIILAVAVDFINTILLQETPPWIIITSMVFLVVYVTGVGGIVGIARCSEFFGPIIILVIIFLVLLMFQDFDSQHFLPIFADTGVIPIMKGALSPLSFLGESVVLLMLAYFSSESNGVFKGAVWGVLAANIIAGIVMLSVLMTFGPELTAKMLYPAFERISYISVMEFVQNLDTLAIIAWHLSIFIKLSLYFFLINYGIAQLIQINSWKKVIWFIAPLLIIFPLIIPDISYVYNYLYLYRIYLALPINMIGIPLILWILGTIRKKISRG